MSSSRCCAFRTSANRDAWLAALACIAPAFPADPDVDRRVRPDRGLMYKKCRSRVSTLSSAGLRRDRAALLGGAPAPTNRALGLVIENGVQPSVRRCHNKTAVSTRRTPAVRIRSTPPLIQSKSRQFCPHFVGPRPCYRRRAVVPGYISERRRSSLCASASRITGARLSSTPPSTS